MASEAEDQINTTDKSVLKTGLYKSVYQEVLWAGRVILSSCNRFYWDNGFSKAAGLAYTTLLSLVPVMALAFSILASFVAQNESVPELRDFIIRIIRQFTPTTDSVDTVLDYLTDFSRTISSLNELAIVFLVITSILLLNSVEYALNEIWQVYQARSITQRIARFCAIIVISPVLAISAYYTTRRFTLGPIFSEMESLNWVISVSNYIMPFIVDFGAFFLLYYLIPKAPVKLFPAIFGSALAALFFGMAKDGFAIYVVKFSSHAAVYGTLAAIPIFLFWLYLAWIIVLLGAECSYQAQYLPKNAKLRKRGVMSIGDGNILLAMQAMVLIARAFQSGAKLPSDLDIAEKLGCSSVVLKPALDLLEKAEIIVRGDSREMPVTLLKSPEKIKVSEIMNALLKNQGSFNYAREMSKIITALSDSRESDMTLQQML